MSNKISIVTDNDGYRKAEVSGKPGVHDVQHLLEEMSSAEINSLSISMPATAAQDFMLIQVLALLRKEGKTITITWTDHEPGSHLLETIKSLIHN